MSVHIFLTLIKDYPDCFYTSFNLTVHPGNSKKKRLLLGPCYLIFRSIVSALVCTLKKFTYEPSVYRKAFIFKTAGVHSSIERSVIQEFPTLNHIDFVLYSNATNQRKCVLFVFLIQ